jgi:hypothetical protein
VKSGPGLYICTMTITEFISALNLKFPDVHFELGNRRVRHYYVARSTSSGVYRVIRRTAGERSVFCFVDAYGNIYKAASWKSPAKGVRAVLDTVDMNTVDQYGSWLYR